RQASPGVGRDLKYLGQRVGMTGPIYVSRGHQYVAVGQNRGRGIPAALVHVRQRSERVGGGVIDHGSVVSDKVGNVASGNKDAPVGQQSVPGAKQFIRRGSSSGEGVGFGIPDVRF